MPNLSLYYNMGISPTVMMIPYPHELKYYSSHLVNTPCCSYNKCCMDAEVGGNDSPGASGRTQAAGRAAHLGAFFSHVKDAASKV